MTTKNRDTKPTPGPWRANHFTADGELHLACAVWTDDGKIPLFRSQFNKVGSTDPSKETSHANLILAAAAPRLAETLRECITDEGATARKSDALIRRRLNHISELARTALAAAGLDE